jgi:ectoine hydroxylase-related dioxygenase (phytanoyl-CoA dioxygenase family)
MLAEELEQDGAALVEKALDRKTVSCLTAALEKLSSSASAERRREAVYGVRNLLEAAPEIREFARSEIVRELAAAAIGAGARVVRAIYFNKTPEANWKVPWHQDLTIAVREKLEIEGYGPWTRKAGVWHVQPPVEILEKMVTLRFHLDDADETNGALKVIPQSHRSGRLTAAQIKFARRANETRLCRVKKSDCLMMRPLILHSSAAGTEPKNRRVIHFECAREALPNGLDWYDS